MRTIHRLPLLALFVSAAVALVWNSCELEADPEKRSNVAERIISRTTGVRANTRFKRDPFDQLFRCAPMAEASRSIVIPLASNVHLAFDAQLLRVHTVWNGPGLNLVGPPYTAQKGPFLCYHEGEMLWKNAPIFPWTIGSLPAEDNGKVPSGVRFRGISTRTGRTTIIYELPDSVGGTLRVEETPRLDIVEGLPAIVRRFELGARRQDLFVLAHAVLGEKWLETEHPAAFTIKQGEGHLTVVARGRESLRWHPVQRQVDYVVAQESEGGKDGLDSVRQTNRVTGMEGRAYLQIPARAAPLTFELTSIVSRERPRAELLTKLTGTPVAPDTISYGIDKRGAPRPSKPMTFRGDPSSRWSEGGDAHYRIERFPVPKELDFLVGGMDWLTNGDLAVCTWPGEVYLVQNAQGPVNAATYRRFARGLNEPLGLKVIDGQIYVVQKHELTRLKDTDGDGEADLFETINCDWGYTGNYHAYAFGPVVDAEKNFFLFITGQRGRWDVPYVGWCARLSPGGGRIEPFCSGLRAPNGFGTFGPENDLFVTDNQGNWVGACKLNHLQPGKFYGFPSGYPAPEADYTGPKVFQAPAVWFPRKLAPSASGIAVISDDRFGPFKGQMLVGDFQNGTVMRVMLEKVKGEWQGAVWPFAKGFLGAVNRLSIGPDGKLYVGGCKRAWSAPAPLEYSLERVTYTGKVPFAIREIHARADGLELVFTQPVDPVAAGDPENYDVSQFAYRYDSAYGSPELDHDGKENSASPIKLDRVVIGPDRCQARLILEGWRAGYVTQVRTPGVKGAEDQTLWQDTFYYTLNRIPD